MDKLVFIFAIALCYANAIVLDEDSIPQDVNRIINGNQAAENQFPYAVSIQQIAAVNPTADPTRGHRCGGVLITHQQVLTAASCLFNNDAAGQPVQIATANFRVFAGSSILTNDIAERVRGIASIHIPEGFIQEPSYVNDIAVVNLTSPFASTVVTPLSLPRADYDPQDFSVCTVAGWGAYNNTNLQQTQQMSPQLRYATKYIYNQDRCTYLYNGVQTLPNILPTMVCAASFDILSSGCMGDLGNALVCNSTLTGILFHPSLDCTAITSFPELYTRVNNYTEWIQNVIGASNMISPAIFMFVLAAIVQVITSQFVL